MNARSAMSVILQDFRKQKNICGLQSSGTTHKEERTEMDCRERLSPRSKRLRDF